MKTQQRNHYWLLISLIIFTSCNKQNETGFTKKILLQDAKAYYEKKSGSLELKNASANLTGNPNHNPRGPEWSKATSYQLNNEAIMEVPLTFKYRRALRMTEKIEISHGVIQKENIRKLIFIRKTDNIIYSAIMTIIPLEEEILIQNEFKYKKVKSGFSGLVLYHSLDDHFLTGWRYENGKIKKQLSKERFTENQRINSEGLSLTDPTRTCYTVYVTRWCIDCTDWYVNGVYDHTSCGSSYPCGGYSYIECEPGSGNCSDCGGFLPDGGDAQVKEQESCNTSIDNFIAAVSVSDQLVSISNTFQDLSTRKRIYRWRILSGLGWALISTEIGVHIKDSNNEWIWKSLDHDKITPTGVIVLMNVKPEVISAEAQLGKYHALMPITFSVLYSMICKGSPISRGIDYYTARAFHVNDQDLTQTFPE